MTATLSEFDRLTSALMATAHIDRDRAEAAVRKSLGVGKSTEKSERDARILEKAEQAEIVKLFRRHGFVVRSTSQARASKIAVGFYDLFCTHKTLPIALFFDSKRQVGSVWSEAQKDFENDCHRCGILCYHGDRYEAQRILIEHKIPETL